MMTYIPDKVDLTAWKGGTFRQRFTVYSGSVGTSPRDLSGYTATFTIEQTDETLPYTSATLTLGGAAGTIDVLISATDTNSFTWEKAVYRLAITGGSNGDTDVLLYGDFTIEDES